MPFTTQMCIATDYDDQQEVIELFSDSDYDVLLIIDENNWIERYKEICGTLNLPYSVMWFRKDSEPDKGRKSIFLNHQFDYDVQNFILRFDGMVGFF